MKTDPEPRAIKALQFDCRDDVRVVIMTIETWDGQSMSFGLTGRQLLQIGDTIGRVEDAYPNIEEW